MIAVRSPIVQVGVRAAGPLGAVVALYLLFAGHNRPGGGFAAGLVLGAVVSLRTVAGLSRPAHAERWLAAGGAIAALTGLLPLLWGDPLFDQIVVTTTVPLLGQLKTGTALLFDIGVTAIVVGLVVAVLDGLGATELSDEAPRDEPAIHKGQSR